MRTFRNAALAGATALALTVSGTSVAMAEDTPNPPAGNETTNTQQADKPAEKQSVAHKIGRDVFKINPKDDTTNESKGEDIFGKEKNWDNVAYGWKLLYGFTWAMGIAAVFSLLIAPIDNFLRYGPFA